MLTDSSQKATWLVLVFANNQTGITKPSGDSWHLTLHYGYLYGTR